MLAGANVPCKVWSGRTDVQHKAVTLKVVRNDDGTFAGTCTFGDKKYFAFGDHRLQKKDEYDIFLYENGRHAGELSGIIDDRGRLLARMQAGTFDEGVNLTCTDSTMPDPFEHPSLDEMKKFTVFSRIVESPEMTLGGSVILVKVDDGFAFSVIGQYSTGFGTVKSFKNSDWTILPYKNGKITYKIRQEGLVIEIFRDFIYATSLDTEEESETSSNYSQGVYSGPQSSDVFKTEWLKIGGDSDADDIPQIAGGDEEEDEFDDTEYVPLERYTDVLAIRELIKEYKIGDLTIPVNLGQASKPNIETYFRAIAKAFPGGILGEALKAADGRRTEYEDTKWILDSRNGYAKAEVPHRSGEEGMEICHWKGNDGRDVVAFCLTYDAVSNKNEFDEAQEWIAIFLRYDPDKRNLNVLATSGKSTSSLFNSEENCNMTPFRNLAIVDSMTLPREGKSIEYRNISGELLATCTWSADQQWFVWDYAKEGIGY